VEISASVAAAGARRRCLERRSSSELKKELKIEKKREKKRKKVKRKRKKKVASEGAGGAGEAEEVGGRGN